MVASLNTESLTYAEIKRHLDNDDCKNNPPCGEQRVLFNFHGPSACCPRCYESLFDAEPSPDMFEVSLIDWADSAPCLDCGKVIGGSDSAYAVDGGGVCVPCGKERGLPEENLLGAMRGYTTMTDAEQNAAAGGHPVGDCEDCGKFHTPWSAHFNDDGSVAFGADEVIRRAVADAIEVLFRTRHHLTPDVLRSLQSIYLCASAARYGEPHETGWTEDAEFYAAHDVSECEQENAERPDDDPWGGQVDESAF